MIDIDGDGEVNYREFYKMASGQSLAPLGSAIPVPKNLQDQLNDEQRIKKMEDLIEKKKAAGEKILFALNTDGLSESDITEEASALEEEEAEEEGEDEDDADY